MKAEHNVTRQQESWTMIDVYEQILIKRRSKKDWKTVEKVGICSQATSLKRERIK